MEFKDNKIIIQDESNKTKEMEIYFTFEKDNKNYVIYFDPNQEGEEIDLFAAIYDDKNNLFPIESNEEWDMIDEMVNAFNEDEDNENEENK